METANEAGFAANLDFIIALPGETAADRRQLLEFMSSLRKKYRVYFQLHHFFPLAGSAFARRLPSFLSADERRAFGALKKNGLASDWWRQGEKNGTRLFNLAGTRFSRFLRPIQLETELRQAEGACRGPFPVQNLDFSVKIGYKISSFR